MNYAVEEEKMIRFLNPGLQVSLCFLLSDKVPQGPVGRRQGHSLYFKPPYDVL